MKIKNVIITALATLGALLGFFLYNRNKKAAVQKIDNEIKETEKEIVAVQEEQKVVEKKRYRRKKKVNKSKTTIAKLEDVKATLVVEEKPTEQVKANILEQTRRGRPKK